MALNNSGRPIGEKREEWRKSFNDSIIIPRAPTVIQHFVAIASQLPVTRFFKWSSKTPILRLDV